MSGIPTTLPILAALDALNQEADRSRARAEIEAESRERARAWLDRHLAEQNAKREARWERKAAKASRRRNR